MQEKLLYNYTHLSNKIIFFFILSIPIIYNNYMKHHTRKFVLEFNLFKLLYYGKNN